MPKHHRQRQRGHRRQRADDEGGADALQRLVEHVVAGQVGAEHVVVAGEHRRRADQQPERGQGPAHHAPRDLRLRHARRPRPRACHSGRAAPRPTSDSSAQRQQRGHAQPEHQAHADAPGQVARPLRLRVLEVRAAELQARRDTLHLAVHLDRFLGEADVGQRARIGGLARLDQPAEQAHRAATACACRRPAPVASRPARPAAAAGSARCPASVSPRHSSRITAEDKAAASRKTLRQLAARPGRRSTINA